jgi:hypothetical protein
MMTIFLSLAVDSHFYFFLLKINFRVGGEAQAVEHLPRKYEGPEFDLPVLNLIFFFQTSQTSECSWKLRLPNK